MKRIFTLVLLLSICSSAFAWNGLGHRTIVLIAQEHLTPKAAENISALMQMPISDLYTEASWMDQHRNDKEYKFSGKYHTFSMTPDFKYDPSTRMATGGDCLTGLTVADYNLSHMEELHLTDSTKIVNLRYVLHIVGDMHCLCHAGAQGVRQNKWIVAIGPEGSEVGFHKYFDGILGYVYPGVSQEEIARKVDTYNKRQIAQVTQGSFYDWIQNCCDRSSIAYTTGTYMELLPDNAPDIFRPSVDEALRFAGYRLAFLLNKYFGK